MKHIVRIVVYVSATTHFSLYPLYNTWKNWVIHNRQEEKKVIRSYQHYFDTQAHYQAPRTVQLLHKISDTSSCLVTQGIALVDNTSPQNSSITFKHIHGEIPEIAHDIVNFLRAPNRAPCENAVIFSGTTGTGKTLLAHAIAGEADAHFITCSGSEFMDQYIGLGSRRVRELFEMAKKNADSGKPVVVLIDEIDGLIRSRKNDDSNAESDLTVNQFLTSIDTHLDKKVPLVFIGTTNREDCCDVAAKRPGRLRVHKFSLPNKSSRKEILQFYAKNMPFTGSIDADTLNKLANDTDKFNCAELEEIIRLANKQAFKLNKQASSTEFLAAHKMIQKKHPLLPITWKQVKEETPIICTFIQTGCSIIQTIYAIIQVLKPEKP